MKILFLVAGFLVLGVLLGLGVTAARFAGIDRHDPLYLHAVDLRALQNLPSGMARATVDSDEHDFGPIEPESTQQHVFHITNLGPGTLQLKPGGTTCQACTIAELSRNSLGPNEVAEVVVVYTAGRKKMDFRQTATILSSDPKRPRIEFIISGLVSTSFRLSPDQLVFSKLSASEAKTAEVKLFSYLKNRIDIASVRLMEDDSAEFFDVKTRPLQLADAGDPLAKAAVAIEIAVKPGLPLGPIRQKIRLATNLPRAEELDIPIGGSIVGDLSLAGQGWSEEQGTLRLGKVDGRVGAKRTLLLLVRGASRDQANFIVVKHTPDFLQAQIGPPTTIAAGAVVQRTLTVIVPPGTASGNYSGGRQAKAGELVLKSDPETMPQFLMHVQFTVEN